MSTHHSQEEEIDVGQMTRRILSKWKLVGAIALVTGIVVAIITIIVPPVWEAKAVIFFPPRETSILGPAGLGDSTGGLASSLLGNSATPIKIFRGFLESETALDYVSEKANLKPKRIEDMRQFKEDQGSSTVTISVFNTNDNTALEVVQLHIDALAQINAAQMAMTAIDDYRVLESKLAEQEKKVKEAEDELLAYQKKAITGPTVLQPTSSSKGEASGVVVAPANWIQQLRALEVELVRIESSLDAAKARVMKVANGPIDIPSDLPPVQEFRPKLVEAEYKLKVEEQRLGPDAPEIRQLKQEIEVIRSELKKEIELYVEAINSEFVDPTAHVNTDIPELLTLKAGLEAQIEAVQKLANLAPKEAMQLGRLTRKLAVETGIYQQLVLQNQFAKLQAERDPNRWTVLDEPKVMAIPANKRFARNGAAGFVVGGLFGCWLALLKTRDRKTAASEQNAND